MRRFSLLALALLAAPLPAAAQTLEERVLAAPLSERAALKAREIAIGATRRSFPSGAPGGVVTLHDLNVRRGGIVEAIVSYKVSGNSRGLGAQGWTRERVRIQNPPIKSCNAGTCVENLQQALEDSLAHTVLLIETGKAPALRGTGNTTLTAYPAASSGGASVDGRVYRTGVDQTLADIRSGAGTTVSVTETGPQFARLVASTTSNQFSENIRAIWTVDTSSIGDADVISSATFSLYGIAKSNGLGSPDLHIAGATPASDNNLVTGDYGQVQTTSYGSVTYAGYSTTGYNDITLNATGIAAVSKTGVTKFSGQTSWDLNNSFTGSWSSSAASYFQCRFADQTGTTNDPKLVVIYSTPATAGGMGPLMGLF